MVQKRGVSFNQRFWGIFDLCNFPYRVAMSSRSQLLFLLWVHLFWSYNSMALYHLLVTTNVRVRARNRRPTRPQRTYSIIGRMPDQANHLRTLIKISDTDCVDNLRMNHEAFCRLAYLLEHIGGLSLDKFVSVSEKLAIFLTVLGHHTKMRVIQTHFKRSKETISKVFNQTLRCVLRISNLLLVDPNPIDENETNDAWKQFKGCLGALDGTFIEVHAPVPDKTWYFNRKGDVTVNMLGVCDKNMSFIYLLSGWEGSATDSRVLRAALGKANGLKVPSGNYYLYDCGYTNADGFLAPYRGMRYHLNEWRRSIRQPQTPEELFNLCHNRARNMIERAFGLLKIRWAVLRNPTWYPIKTQNHIILACELLHNFIRLEMDIDPMEAELADENDDPVDEEDDFIAIVDCSHAWTDFRDNLASTMFNEWRSG